MKSIQHHFINNDDSEAVGKCESGVRNPWHWHWLNEKCEKGIPFNKWCMKISKPGQCYCTSCDKPLVYGSSGKRALRLHANSPDHRATFAAKSSSAKFIASTDTNSVTCSITNKACEIKSRVSLFLAEHCLPYTLAPELLALAKKISSDPATLQSVSMNRTAATYTTTHGVAHSIKKTLGQKLQGSFFSLNVDEATNNAGDKVLNVLAQYYDNSLEKCIVQLLGVRVVNIATSHNIAAAIGSVLEERGLKWSQVVSVMMDNCNVMRGIKDGVEVKLRRENSSLLDVSGDTVHMLNNAAKKLFVPIERDFAFENVCSNVYYDIEDSPKVRSLFKSIQEILYKNSRSIIRPIANRFNQMLVVANRLNDLWDALIIYYSGFLTPEEKKKEKAALDKIYMKYEVTEENKIIIEDILKKQKKQDKTDASKQRKDKILRALFYRQVQTIAILHLYRGILSRFEKFIKKFQSVKPQAHCLHLEIFTVVKDFFSFFINPDQLPLYDAKALNTLNYQDSENQLRDSSLFVGEMAKPHLLTCSKDKTRHGQWLKSFYKALREGYISAAPLIRKLPLMNKTLITLTFISPSNQRSDRTTDAIIQLAQSLPNVISHSDLGVLDSELRSYTTDSEVSLIDVDEEDPEFRIDECWWAHIFKLKEKGEQKYPCLSKLVKGLLTIFSGPLVESTFNIMDDILEADRTRMTAYNYEALALIKSDITAKKVTANTYDVTDDMKECVATSYKRYQQYQDINKTSAFTSAATSTSVSAPPSFGSAPAFMSYEKTAFASLSGKTSSSKLAPAATSSSKSVPAKKPVSSTLASKPSASAPLAESASSSTLNTQSASASTSTESSPASTSASLSSSVSPSTFTPAAPTLSTPAASHPAFSSASKKRKHCGGQTMSITKFFKKM